MLRLTLMLAAVAAASPALAQPPGSAGSPLQVEVNNEVDVEVQNSVDSTRLTDIAFGGGIGGGVGALIIGLPEGRLHAASLSLNSANPGERCFARAAIVYGDTFGGAIRNIGLGAMAVGDTQSVSQKFDAPIEAPIDAVEGNPKLVIYVTASSASCYAYMSTMYEPNDPLAQVASDALIVRDF